MSSDEWIKTDLAIAEADLDRLRERLADADKEAKSLRSQLAASLRLQADLAEENVRLRLGLEWQTGIMPEVGWYWVKDDPSDPECINPFCVHVEDLYLYMHLQWSGPIPMPREKEGE